MSVEDAIQLAIETVKKLFGGSDHRLEEIERQESAWEVTVSYRAPDAPRLLPLGNETYFSSLQGRRAAIGIDPSRTYKDVLISEQGEVKAVRMRQIVVG